MTFSDLGKAATFRDPVALAMTQEIALELSLALSNLICTVNPSLIVLGGKIPDLGEAFLEDVPEKLKKDRFPPYGGRRAGALFQAPKRFFPKWSHEIFF